jgi:hypothetical protein
MYRALAAARRVLVLRAGLERPLTPLEARDVRALEGPFVSEASRDVRVPQQVFKLSQRMQAVVRKRLILEGYEWPLDLHRDTQKQFPRPVKTRRTKRRLLNPEKKLRRIQEAVPRREAMLQSHARKKRSRHKVQIENLNMHQIVKYRMKDE